MNRSATLLTTVFTACLALCATHTFAQTPSVTTNAASAIQWHTADLNGTMTGNGTTVFASFDYGPSIAYTGNIGATPSQSSSSSPVAFSASISGLSQNTLYHYRAVIFTGTGFIYGPDRTFTTKPPVPPTVSSPAVVYHPGDTFATFTANVNANSFATNAYVQFCLAGDNFSSPAFQMSPLVLHGITPTPVSYLAPHIQLNQQYEYRIIATNAWGFDTSAVLSFSTASLAVSTGLEEAGIRIYPNPISDHCSIDASACNGDISIMLTDARGQKLAVPVVSNGKKHQLNTSQLPAGNYWLHISNQKHSYSSPLVKR